MDLKQVCPDKLLTAQASVKKIRNGQHSSGVPTSRGLAGGYRRNISTARAIAVSPFKITPLQSSLSQLEKRLYLSARTAAGTG